ncbi:hypothetical protein HY450_04040 [Candidatus Pacearchaeota archaeon]|nr:hypothetical protein [Candidatus Pacearchaeota archaeon]
MENKKGLSDIIATVLIVLLALAAVAVVWSFIQPAIKNTGGSIDLQTKCLNTEVKPTACTVTGGTGTVNIQLVKGEATKVVAVIEDSLGATYVGETDAPNPLATKSVSVPSVGSASPFNAKAAAIVSDAEGNTATCDVGLVQITCL